MPKLRCVCTYCGHDFVEFVYTTSDVEALKCPKCKDRNLKRKEETSGDYYGYNNIRQEDAYLKPPRKG